ncbi:hypothetical protein ACFSC3_11160 [Sphingomonas floccifaciens]|uniref:Uncharacterized protein n=1 Tax=Sphingomonas floccifaciens TaxID=1844115 RepID=A0ABW4NDL8_9SPHN
MQTLALLLMLAAPGGETIVAQPSVPPHCSPTADKTRGAKAPNSMKLGDQPPAAQVLTVFRRDASGCPKPVVLREGIGANPEKARPIQGGGALLPVR